MPLPPLTAVVLARDEAANLPRCLAALRGLVAQVLVVDTGSVDASVELARAAGARVLRRRWEGDFARARNAALEHVATPWALSVDADEEAVGDPAELAGLLAAGEGVDALAVDVANPYPGTSGEQAHVHSPVRLFRPGAARWEAAVHEQLRGPGGTPLALGHCPRSALSLRHSGYGDPAQVRAKAARNAALARATLEQLAGAGAPAAPRRARALFDLGRSLLAADDPGGAVQALRAAREEEPGGWTAVQALDFLARAELSVASWPGAAGWVEQLRAAGAPPGYCDWLQARVLIGVGRPGPALELLRGVDGLVDTLGCDLGVGLVVELRAQAAALAGQVSEAIACLLLAMLVHGRVAGRGPDLLRLWGERPAPALVELIRSAGAAPAAFDAVVAELRGSPEPGPLVAAALGRC